MGSTHYKHKGPLMNNDIELFELYRQLPDNVRDIIDTVNTSYAVSTMKIYKLLREKLVDKTAAACLATAYPNKHFFADGAKGSAYFSLLSQQKPALEALLQMAEEEARSYPRTESERNLPVFKEVVQNYLTTKLI
jgi:hypothetical protein